MMIDEQIRIIDVETIVEPIFCIPVTLEEGIAKTNYFLAFKPLRKWGNSLIEKEDDDALDDSDEKDESIMETSSSESSDDEEVEENDTTSIEIIEDLHNTSLIHQNLLAASDGNDLAINDFHSQMDDDILYMGEMEDDVNQDE